MSYHAHPQIFLFVHALFELSNVHKLFRVYGHNLCFAFVRSRCPEFSRENDSNSKIGSGIGGVHSCERNAEEYFILFHNVSSFSCGVQGKEESANETRRPAGRAGDQALLAKKMGRKISVTDPAIKTYFMSRFAF